MKRKKRKKRFGVRISMLPGKIILDLLFNLRARTLKTEPTRTPSNVIRTPWGGITICARAPVAWGEIKFGNL
jgi:hypothetical protein